MMQRVIVPRSRSMGLSPALGEIGELAYPGLVLFVVFVALVCGGGTRQGLWSDAFAQIVSLPLLAVAAFRLRALSAPSKLRLPLFLVFAVVSVPVLQLIPLPPRVWTILPGRAEVAEAYTAAGMSLPFLPISLEPLTTLRSVLSLLPAVAVFVGILCLREEAELRWVLLLIFSVAIVGAGLELLQLIGGEASPLRFYNITSLSRGVGFFANQNHQAAFLYGTIAYAATWVSLTWARRARRRPNARRAFSLTFSAILLIALVVGLVATLSRFGLILGLVAGLCSIPLVASLATNAARGRVIMVAAIANVVALLLMFQFGFVGIAERLSQTLSTDLRWPLVSITARAANDYFPFGSGIGTFAPIYQRYEPLEYLMEAYVNRAHNDWLETWLEGGLANAVVVCALMACYLFLAYQSWRTANPNLRLVPYARAGSICVALLLIHSILDYPLRTTALMVMVAISCAFMLRAHLEKAATSVAHSTPLPTS
jgi:O-antigen ligase